MSESSAKPNGIAVKRGPGRPSIFTEELAAQILKRHAAGESLRAICAEPAMPHRTTLELWREADRGGFSSDLARARKLFAEARALRSGEHLYDLEDADLKNLGNAASSAVKLRESRSKHDQWLAQCLDRDTWGERVGVDLNAQVTMSTQFASTLPLAAVETIRAEYDAEVLRAEGDATDEGASETPALPEGGDS